MATQIILENADKLEAINISDFTENPVPNYGRNAHKSFFLQRELSHTQNSAKRFGIYRHCKPYKGHFLDYIVRKEFATLEDWVADCSSTIDEIRFGYQKFDGATAHITLDQLINHLDPMPSLIPFEDTEMDELTKFANKLHIDELSLKNLLVRTHTSGLLTYNEYMQE